jgi:hypothetical protein
MMMTQEELSKLLDLVKENSQTFDNVLSQFNKVFPKNDQFRACMALCYLIENNVSLFSFNQLRSF